MLRENCFRIFNWLNQQINVIGIIESKQIKIDMLVFYSLPESQILNFWLTKSSFSERKSLNLKV